MNGLQAFTELKVEARIVAKSLVFLSCFSYLLYPPTNLRAQTASETYWQQLRIADKSISASQVTWRATDIYPPDPKVDPDKAVAQALDEAQRRHLDAAETKDRVEMYRETAQRWKAGYTTTTFWPSCIKAQKHAVMS